MNKIAKKNIDNVIHSLGWAASLALRFTRHEARTILSDNRHRGPLRIQKTLYPEGEKICHAVIVHPPAGIAGGDSLSIEIALDQNAQALITTPGAAKWYKSNGIPARQTLNFSLAPKATLEWLPQETIVFDSAQAEMITEVNLAAGACYFGWDILCFGRTASGEQFGGGSVRQRIAVRYEGKLLWNEAGVLAAADRIMNSPVGLQGDSICATLIAAGPTLDSEIVDSLRVLLDQQCENSERIAITRVPQLFVARYLGDSSERAKKLFTTAWNTVRPELVGADPHAPRVWNT